MEFYYVEEVINNQSHVFVSSKTLYPCKFLFLGAEKVAIEVAVGQVQICCNSLFSFGRSLGFFIEVGEIASRFDDEKSCEDQCFLQV